MFETNLRLLEATREATLRQTAHLTPEQASRRPSPQAWSVAEVLEHLLISETLYREMIARLIGLYRSGRRPSLSQGLADIDTVPPFVPKELLRLMDIPLTMMNLFVPPFVRERMMTIRLFKAQSPTIARPKADKPVDQLRAELAESVCATARLLRDNADVDFRRLRYSHPVLGANNVMGILRIVAFHEKRHQQQIDEILSSQSFPKAA